METAGIVAEYNPFHGGHAFHIAETRRRLGGCAVVAVMSGNWVQRGECAVLDKWTRTRAALEKLEDFRSQECAAIVEDLLLHHMPQAAETGLLEIQAQLRLYEDDNAEDLLRQLLGRLEEEEGSQ